LLIIRLKRFTRGQKITGTNRMVGWVRSTAAFNTVATVKIPESQAYVSKQSHTSVLSIYSRLHVSAL